MVGNDAAPTLEQLQDLILESPGFSEFLLGLTAISASMPGPKERMLCAITVEYNKYLRGLGGLPPHQARLLAIAMREMDSEPGDG